MKTASHYCKTNMAAALVALGTLLVSSAAIALECGDTVTESVTLGEDIICTDPGDTGIIVGASNVTIDLNGHSISGFKREGSVGILVRGVSNVTIQNGTVEFFARGVVVDVASSITVGGIIAKGHRQDGIYVEDSNLIDLTDNHLWYNVNGIVIRNGNNLRLVSNRAKKNSVVDFDVSQGVSVTLENNDSQGNTGFAAYRTTGPAEVSFAGNRAIGFKGYGFQFADVAADSITDGGGNRANGKASQACFVNTSDPCPLILK